MPVVHVRGKAEDRASAADVLAVMTEAIAIAVPCPPEHVWCTFTTIDRQTIGGAPRDGEGRIVYVDVWIHPRADDAGAATRSLEAACRSAAAGFGVPVEDVWGTLRHVEPFRVFAGGALTDG
jgi:hypothetical protein